MSMKALSNVENLHKCAYKGCKELIDAQYKFCYEHRGTVYEDTCRIHGKTKFQQGQCLKCELLKIPSYRLTYREKCWYDMYSVLIDKNHYLYPYLKRLTKKTRKAQEPYIQKISAKPGIYGIFVRNGAKLGKCLYVGQSINIKQRVYQHRECFKKAQRHIIGIRMHNKRASINQIKQLKTEFKYYKMANKYKLSDLKFVRLMNVPYNQKQLSYEQYKDILTYAEQAMIDAYKPSLNLFAARPSN